MIGSPNRVFLYYTEQILSLTVALIKQDVYKISNKTITDIQGMINKEIQGSSFVRFGLKLSTAISYQPRLLRNASNMNLSGYDFKPDLKDFIKIISFYSNENFETIFNQRIIPANNSFFKRIAQSTSVSRGELLGLIDFICHKKNSKYTSALIKGMIMRMNLNKDNFEVIRSLIHLFLSKDETIILRSLNTLSLDLTYGQFLLVGRGILNPKLVPTELFESVGITDEELLDEKNTVSRSTPENFAFWKTQVRSNITRTLAGLKSANRSKFTVQAELVKEYLGDWDAAAYSKSRIASILKVLNNNKNKIEKNILVKENGASYDFADFLVIIINLRNLQLEKGKKWTTFSKEQEDTIKQLSSYLSMSSEDLKHFLQLFILSDRKTVAESFSHFFADDKIDETDKAETLNYALGRVESLQEQNLFIQEELPRVLSLPNERNPDVHFKLPPAVIKKLLSKEPKVDLQISDFLEVANSMVRKLKLTKEEGEQEDEEEKRKKIKEEEK